MENEIEATQETPELMKATLEGEKKARAAAEAALTEKDKRIGEMQAEGEALRAERNNLMTQLAELTQVKEAHSRAVAKYLEAARALSPSIPEDVIAGATIEEIDASLARARSIADSVKKALEAQAKEARVPAGAPARGEISLDALSPREKIAAGLTQKGRP